MTNPKLKALLKILADFNVQQYEDNGLKITMGVKPLPVQKTPKDLSEKTKQKEQEDEDLLYHSAQR